MQHIKLITARKPINENAHRAWARDDEKCLIWLSKTAANHKEAKALLHTAPRSKHSGVASILKSPELFSDESFHLITV